VMDQFDESSLSKLSQIAQCTQCEINYVADEYNRIEVIISFPINLPIIDWSMRTKIKAKTIPLF